MKTKKPWDNKLKNLCSIFFCKQSLSYFLSQTIKTPHYWLLGKGPPYVYYRPHVY